MHIDRRKNDTVRKGHFPALGRSKGPALDIVVQLRTRLRIAGLAVHPIGQEDPASGSLRSMPPVVPAHEVLAGRRHGGHGSAVLASASERLDSLGRRTGGERL